MKTRNKEYLSIDEPSALTTSDTSKKIGYSLFTFISDDESSSSDYELLIEPEKKMNHSSDTEEYYVNLINKLKLKFRNTTTRDDAGKQHEEQYPIECETSPKELEMDVMEDNDDASFSKFQDYIRTSMAKYNATSTPLPTSSISINDVQFDSMSDVSGVNIVRQELESPLVVSNVLDIQPRSHYTHTLISKRSVHCDEMELQKVPLVKNLNIQLDEIEEYEETIVDNNESSSSCNGAVVEEDKSEELNERQSNDNDQGSKSTDKQISLENHTEHLDEEMYTLLKRKVDVGVQTMLQPNSVKRTKIFNNLNNLFKGHLQVYSINRLR